jgi:hypothetical protein
MQELPFGIGQRLGKQSYFPVSVLVWEDSSWPHISVLQLAVQWGCLALPQHLLASHL